MSRRRPLAGSREPVTHGLPIGGGPATNVGRILAMYFLLDILYAIQYISFMKLRNHIKQHRARMNLTQEELAGLVGVQRQAILAIEKGKYVPSALLAFELARVLRMNITDLFELIEEGETHE